MPDQIIISQEGYDKLKEELDHLTNVKRFEIAERIEKAKDLGDLSENAEYSEAKDAQALNDGRIMDILAMLKNSVVVDKKSDAQHVSMGSEVTVEVAGQKKVYTIVSFNEANPSDGKISNESPIGMAFFGKKKGDTITVETPRGEILYKIVNIQ
ncbi:MAG: transcription elongation factor GreA [Candidatus Falkowbacteria bacterium]